MSQTLKNKKRNVEIYHKQTCRLKSHRLGVMRQVAFLKELSSVEETIAKISCYVLTNFHRLISFFLKKSYSLPSFASIKPKTMAHLKTLRQICCKMRIEGLTILTTKHNVAAINKEENK